MTTVHAQADSTRVFVSGLPPSLTSDQLALHFRKQYNVTDAHVFADRRIGFVGFNDTSTARDAVKHFNRSYIRMSRISVDIAKPVDVQHNASGQAVPVSRRDNDLGSKKNHLIRPSLPQKNDLVDPTSNTKSPESRKRKRDVGDDGETAGDGSVLTKDRSRSTVNAQEMDNNSDDPTQGVEQVASNLQPRSDEDWLRGRTSRVLDLISTDESTLDTTKPSGTAQLETDASSDVGDDDNHSNEATKVSETPNDTQHNQSIPNARLFLRNLAFDVTDQDLEQKFADFGKVQEVHVVKDVRKATSKGMAFVQFSNVQNAEIALKAMDGVAFHGRLLHILPASDKRNQKLTDYDISKLPLKKQKEIRRKQDAATASFSWNSLYMNPDAVMSSIAQRLGVAKSDILDATSADAAIKQAHAETQIIAETKAYLRTHGVNVGALENQKRDDRTVLLKNFPYGTTENELKDLLEPFGQISRFMLPPAGTMAIVQFDEPYAATSALRGMAYKNIKGSVLYMEKAPHGLLDGSITSIKDENKSTETADSKDPDPAASTASTGPTATVFVRNLNFSTTGSRLTETFSPLAGFLSARVKTRTDPKRPGEILSMGFGFVEFKTQSQANSAIATMNGYKLDNHELLVKLSTKANDLAEERRQDDRTKNSDANNTKILIKNLPFQASRKDVRALFAPYGQLKTVRVPKKFDNTSRGFGFAEFITAKEAENAMEALANTHLLGRRLVLNFASEAILDPDAEISALERKMEQQSNRFSISKLTGTGRRRFNISGDQEDV